jgi:hypothetical protein
MSGGDSYRQKEDDPEVAFILAWHLGAPDDQTTEKQVHGNIGVDQSGAHKPGCGEAVIDDQMVSDQQDK